MIALERIGHAAAGQKGSPQKGRAAALLLKQGKVDVQRKVLRNIVAQRFKYAVKLCLVRQAKDVLSAALVRKSVEGE